MGYKRNFFCKKFSLQECNLPDGKSSYGINRRKPQNYRQINHVYETNLIEIYAAQGRVSNARIQSGRGNGPTCPQRVYSPSGHTHQCK